MNVLSQHPNHITWITYFLKVVPINPRLFFDYSRLYSSSLGVASKMSNRPRCGSCPGVIAAFVLNDWPQADLNLTP